MKEFKLNTEFITDNQILEYEKITNLYIENTGSYPALINGKRLNSGKSMPLLLSTMIADKLKLDIKFPNNDISGNRVELSFFQVNCDQLN